MARLLTRCSEGLRIQDHDTAGRDGIDVAMHGHLLSQCDNVFRGRQGSVYGAVPAIAREGGELKLQALPVHVHHHMYIGIPTKARQSEGESSGLGILPTRRVE